MSEVNLEEVRLKLYNNLKESGWGDKLKTFILSSDFMNILIELKSDSQIKRNFTPKIKYIFRAFEECPYNKLKVVLIGQDPYPYHNTADGILFSCSLKGIPESSLKYIFKEINTTVYNDPLKEHNPDLARWSNQGILGISTSFTTLFNKIGAHHELWRPFINFLIDTLNIDNPDLIYVFIGKRTQEWIHFLPDDAIKFSCTHPASGSFDKDNCWDSGDIFNKINHALAEQKKQEIIW